MFAGYRVEMSRIIENSRRNPNDIRIVRVGHFDTPSKIEATRFANTVAAMKICDMQVEVYALIRTRQGMVKLPEAELKSLIRDLCEATATEQGEYSEAAE
jgi:hypothetical protein